MTGASWRLGLFTNRWIIGGVLVQIAAQALTYTPFMNQVFGTAPIESGVWLRILAAVVLISLVIAADKFVALRRLDHAQV